MPCFSEITGILAKTVNIRPAYALLLFMLKPLFSWFSCDCFARVPLIGPQYLLHFDVLVPLSGPIVVPLTVLYISDILIDDYGQELSIFHEKSMFFMKYPCFPEMVTPSSLTGPGPELESQRHFGQ